MISCSWPCAFWIFWAISASFQKLGARVCCSSRSSSSFFWARSKMLLQGQQAILQFSYPLFRNSCTGIKRHDCVLHDKI